jgi:hypothetical protein
MRGCLVDLTLAENQVAVERLRGWIAQEEKTWIGGPEARN